MLMSDNDWKSRLGMVYSTDPNFQYRTAGEDGGQSVPAAQQDLRVWLDRSHRAGKCVTLVRGFRGPDSELKELATMLKSRCGVGGSAKDGEVIVQGDHRERVLDILIKAGYKAKKAGG